MYTKRLVASVPVRLILTLGILAASGAHRGAAQTPSFDALIRNGTVYDGTGGAGRRADVGIRGDRIAAIGDLAGATAAVDSETSSTVTSRPWRFMVIQRRFGSAAVQR